MTKTPWRAGVILLSLAASTLQAAEQSSGSPPAAATEATDSAKKLFDRYVALEHAFDPAMADLYDDNAVIKNRRTYPTGQVRELSLPAPKYKELIRASMPAAKARGDKSTYSDCTYEPESESKRV